MSMKSMRVQLCKYDHKIKHQREELNFLRQKDNLAQERIDRAEEFARYYYDKYYLLQGTVKDENKAPPSVELNEWIKQSIESGVADTTPHQFIQSLFLKVIEIKAPPSVELKYNELLYAVGKKYPDESRHDTALRYIKEAETSDGQTSKALEVNDD